MLFRPACVEEVSNVVSEGTAAASPYRSGRKPSFRTWVFLFIFLLYSSSRSFHLFCAGGLEKREDGREFRAFLFGRYGLDQDARRGERVLNVRVRHHQRVVLLTCRGTMANSFGLTRRCKPITKPVVAREPGANGVPDACDANWWNFVPSLVALTRPVRA